MKSTEFIVVSCEIFDAIELNGIFEVKNRIFVFCLIWALQTITMIAIT